MLHNDKELFEQLVFKTSEVLGIEASIIEKDYFVTLFLKQIANEIRKEKIDTVAEKLIDENTEALSKLGE